MDTISRISFYFPTRAITVFQIVSNMIINDSSECVQQERNLVIAIIALMAVVCFCSSFTDTFTASNGQKSTVFIVPFYGPICFSLPTDEDKDRLYDFYFFKGRDLAHGIMATAAFVLISIFMNPVCMCLFPSHQNDGTSSFDSSIVRTIPVVVALIIALMMVCLGPPRQLIGFQNVPETAPLNEDSRSDQENPIFHQKMSSNDAGMDDGVPQKGTFYPRSDITASRNTNAGVSGGGGGGSVSNSQDMYGQRISTLPQMRQSQQRERLGADGGGYFDKGGVRQSRASLSQGQQPPYPEEP